MIARNPGPTAIECIAQWSSTLTLDAVPEEVRRVARACIKDTLGVALAGARTSVASLAREYAFTTAAEGAAAVLGADRRLAATGAAFANAVAAHALDFDDNCYAGVVHGSAVVMPAALAATQAADGSGADFLTAFIAGSEAEYAVGLAATRALYDRGWWTTAALGPIGSCVAAAHALRLDARATAAALGLAVAGTGGAKASFGSDGKPLLAGRAAEAGVCCAYLAAQGASGPHDALESARGFAGLLNGGLFNAGEMHALGTRWCLVTPGIDVKRIPLCLSAHAAVDAVRDLLLGHAIELADIRRVVCDVPAIVVANLVHPRPRSPQEAQFSMPFAIAATLLFGDVGLEQLDDATLIDERLCALMSRVEMTTSARWSDPALRDNAPEGAQVRIERAGAPPLETFRACASGTAAHPLAAAEIDLKFRSCAGQLMGRASLEQLLQRVDALDRQQQVRNLLAA